MEEIKDVSDWLVKVKDGNNVRASYLWYVDKEKIYEKYHGRLLRSVTKDSMTEYIKIPKRRNKVQKKLIEVLVLPDSKIIIPMRQFCDHYLLKLGENEKRFYSPRQIKYRKVTECSITDQSDHVTSSTVNTRSELNGASVKIGYSDIENMFNLVSTCEDSFALESVADENRILLSLFNGHLNCTLFNGDGLEIGADEIITRPLSIKALLNAKEKMGERGIDISNLILYTDSVGEISLIKDPGVGPLVDYYSKQIITIHTIEMIEMITGIRICRDKNIPIIQKTILEEYDDVIEVKESTWQRFKRLFTRKPILKVKKWRNVTKNIRRSVLFVPNQALGLVSSPKITMEAQRRNEVQAVYLTGATRVSGVIKDNDSVVVIEHV